MGGTGYEEARSVDLTGNGGYILAGSSGFQNVNNGDVSGNHGGYDFWITKLSSGTPVADNSQIDQQLISKPSLISLKVSPNPSISFLSVSINAVHETAFLKITNSSGKTMLGKTIQKEDYQQQLNISSFPAGLYFIKIQSGNDNISGTFIKK